MSVPQTRTEISMPLPSPAHAAAARGARRLVAASLLLGGLLGCGYKGPLYLPPPEDPPAELTVPPSSDAPPGPSAN
jgi:predicted small lipoprotein YifL